MTGIQKFATAGKTGIPGKLAGGVLLAASGLFSAFRMARLGSAPTGARAAATTHVSGQRAPIQTAGKTFYCPLWPDCGCPGGTTRPECPGLQQLRGV